MFAHGISELGSESRSSCESVSFREVYHSQVGEVHWIRGNKAVR